MMKVSGMELFSPSKDKCQMCAVAHEPDEPHDQQSLYWQYYFFGQHNRWPTWADAMAHCTDEVKAVWTYELKKHGIDVEFVVVEEPEQVKEVATNENTALC